MSDYAHPQVLVSTQWVADNLDTPGVTLIEVDVDTDAYDTGHAPGAIGLNWQTQLQDQTSRDIVSAPHFAQLLSDAGVSPADTVVLYGDNNNWFAAYAFWLFRMYGHENVRLMNGGRVKWLAEKRPLTTDVPTRAATSYPTPTPDRSLRAHLPDVSQASKMGTENLVDVRSPDEFTGKLIAPPGMSESAQRGGHVPGATSIPWAKAVAEDGTFKPANELEQIYFDEGRVDRSRPTIAYCRIGERSSHTWFVLKYLLGLDNVRNYDGSWTEYGSVIGVPIEKGAPAAVSA
ncbi:MAG: sulfurtransferase [Phycisphaerales bacterium]|nr:sulfurtransferase [Phycisphaerae bacterium]NNM26060.1 sulfurtransferase [Phycisphaerales bacterium]